MQTTAENISEEAARHAGDGPAWDRLVWIWWGRAFALGSLVHITLPDFAQPGWTGPQIVEGIGALILLWRPRAIGFLLCFIGTLWPLLFLRDVLTQSMLLTWMGALGLYGLTGHRKIALACVTWITAGTYWLAALHKLNTGFLDPAVSCGQHALQQLVIHWSWLPEMNPGVELSVLIIAVEVIIGVLLIRRSPWVWLLGICFHLPLTVTLAPAFAFVMFAGYASALTPRQLVVIRRVLRQHRLAIILGALALAVFEFVSQNEPAWDTVFKCAVLGAILLTAYLTVRTRHRAAMVPLTWSTGVVMALWIVHGLTPYLGLQYQHTAAMLSNLRIDAECHNSLVFPKGLVIKDPYIRIKSASIGTGQRPERERVLEGGLWSYPALATMHRNWCVEELRPIRLVGRCAGVDFEIEDLCMETWAHTLPCREALLGLQRFQKNLRRACEVPCIH